MLGMTAMKVEAGVVGALREYVSHWGGYMFPGEYHISKRKSFVLFLHDFPLYFPFQWLIDGLNQLIAFLWDLTRIMFLLSSPFLLLCWWKTLGGLWCEERNGRKFEALRRILIASTCAFKLCWAPLLVVTVFHLSLLCLFDCSNPQSKGEYLPMFQG